jgi:hypothetical protein
MSGDVNLVTRIQDALGATPALKPVTFLQILVEF